MLGFARHAFDKLSISAYGLDTVQAPQFLRRAAQFLACPGRAWAARLSNGPRKRINFVGRLSRAKACAVLAVKLRRKAKLYGVSRLEMRVAWSTPSLSQVPMQITRSLSLIWLASMSLTFLLPCS